MLPNKHGKRENEKWKPKTEIHYPFPVLFPFFFFQLPMLASRSPTPRPPFLVISEIILLNNTICIEKAERWKV